MTSPAATDPPRRTLRSGASIPAIGLGTFGSDRYGPAEVAGAVRGAIQAGYRLIDCASVYGNEPAIGEVLAEALRGGVERDELFVATKIWNDAHSPADAVASVERSLADLRLDHLDAVFVHWPFRNAHTVGAHGDERDPDARPYEHSEYLETWGALEGLVDDGLVRHLGTSNVTVPKLRRIVQDVRIRPELNEMELHPCFAQPELFEFCVEHGIQPIAYSPLGSPSRPERDRTAEDVVDIEHPAVLAIAAARGIHPALVCLLWAVTRGQIPIPFAVKPEQYHANLRAIHDAPLTNEEMDALRAADVGSRLIKGQVFLWPGADSWLDLWDLPSHVMVP